MKQMEFLRGKPDMATGHEILGKWEHHEIITQYFDGIASIILLYAHINYTIERIPL